jgi:hypothetical protein
VPSLVSLCSAKVPSSSRLCDTIGLGVATLVERETQGANFAIAATGAEVIAQDSLNAWQSAPWFGSTLGSPYGSDFAAAATAAEELVGAVGLES